jgi:hypothetical protein
MWGAQSQTIQRAFAQGELAPSVTARADLALYHAGLATCRNFLVRRQGGIVNRPGTVHVATAKVSDGRAWLFPFVFPAADASFIVEAGEFYFRFHKNGAPVLVTAPAAWSGATAYVVGDVVVSGGTNYWCKVAHTNQAPPNATYWYAMPASGVFEIPHTWVEGRFMDPAPVGWSQSGLTVTLTHLEEAPLELTYGFNDTTWTLETVSTEPGIGPAPDTLGATGSVEGDGYRAYKVTAISSAVPPEESTAPYYIELEDTIEPTPEAPIRVYWDAVAGASEYKVYLDVAGNGVFGFIGRASTNEFFDPGLAPDYFHTPPQARVLFNAENAYPAVSCTYQQRRWFAGTHDARDIVHGSRIGFYSNFSIRSPLQDDDAVTFRIASQFCQPVLHLVGLDRLVLFTDTGIWLAYGDSDGALTPTRINADQKGYLGSSFVQPVVVGERIIYIQARATRVRDLQYQREYSGYEGMGSRDLTFLSGHLFKGFTLTDLAYAHEPFSIIWAVRSDGALLGCTYVPEDDLWGWHIHDTGASGAFEQVVSIPEGSEDAVYVVVRRQIDGNDQVTIERFASRQYTDHVDAIHLDAAITYEGASTTAITGLDHLEGETVYAWTNGTTYQGPFTVSGGAITLTTAATTAHVGLEIVFDAELLDLDANGTDLRGKRKRVQAVAFLLEDSRRGFQVGKDEDHLLAHRAETWDTSTVVDGLEEITITSAFTPGGRVFIRLTRPTPLAINAVLPVFENGS